MSKTQHPKPRRIFQSKPKQAGQIKTEQKQFKHNSRFKVSVKIVKKGEKRGWREGASQPSLDY